MAEIVLDKITKSFENRAFFKDFSLKIDSNKVTVLLGPTGCGKSTLLKIIAGLLEVESGSVYIDNVAMNNVPPSKRKVGMIFQQNTLFPHMKVQDNIEFGLIAHGWTRETIKNRVANLAELLKLKTFLKRYPAELSGGEQQKVAIARALAPMPAVLLLDEPLSSLDARVKQEILGDLKVLQKKLSLTYVYVTHDHEEAFAIGDKIVVINNGAKMQEGTPEEIYNRPNNEFVAWFVGYNKIVINSKSYYVKPDKIAITDNGAYSATLESVSIGKGRLLAVLDLKGTKFTVILPSKSSFAIEGKVGKEVKFEITEHLSF